MLTKISIQGFKSIYNISDLELGLVNVFIGANGSGKSNLLEAIGVLGAAIEESVNPRNLLERGVRYGNPALFKASLKDVVDKPLIQFNAQVQHKGIWHGYELHLNNPIENLSERWTYELEKIWEGGEEKWSRILNEANMRIPDLPGSLHIPNIEHDRSMVGYTLRSFSSMYESPIINLYRSLSEYVIFAPTTPVLRGIQPDMYQRDPMGIFGGRLVEAIEEILTFEDEEGLLGTMDLDEVLDLLDWVDTFEITSPSKELISANVPTLRTIIKFQDYWMNGGRNALSGYDASEGALYVLFMLVLALHPRIPSLFAVDNFNQALNPRLARALTQKFCELIIHANPSKQVLLTTHNPLVLDGLNLTDDRIRLFAVDRNRSTGGATQVKRIQVSEDIINANQEGLSLSNLWTMGRLGAVPNI